MKLRAGKLDADLLARLLGEKKLPPEVIVGPGIGHDVAVLDEGGEYLQAVKADPVTFATEAIGTYAVAVNANDIATSGGEPRWFLATVLLPEGQATEEMARSITRQLQEACAVIGVALIGGHTEVTGGIDRPLVAGMMLGQIPRERLVRPEGTREGDYILLTKGIPVEGVSLIAREKKRELAAAGVSSEMLARCADFLHNPGIMVLPEARILCDTIRPHAMHDPTEGGLATALWEMAQAGGVGMRIDRELIPVFPEALQLCSHYGLDPLGVIASGALLAAVDPDDAPAAIEACRQAGIACAVIGEAVRQDLGVILVEGGAARPMPRYDQDEITRIF